MSDEPDHLGGGASEAAADAEATEGRTDRGSTDEGSGARDDDHLCDLEDGAGCVEIWERLAELRKE